MKQREIEQQIANQTGESLQTIHHLGFSPLRAVHPIEEREKPLMVDWDLEQQTRYERGSI